MSLTETGEMGTFVGAAQSDGDGCGGSGVTTSNQIAFTIDKLLTNDELDNSTEEVDKPLANADLDHSTEEGEKEEMSVKKAEGEEMGLIRAIEKMLDAKFDKLEQRLNRMEEKNEKFTSDITELVKTSRFNDIIIHPPLSHSEKEVGDDVQSGDGSTNDCLGTKALPNDFTVTAVEQKLLDISESIDNYEKQRSEDAAKIMEACSKYKYIEEKMQGIEELQDFIPQLTSIQRNLDTMLAGESDANDVIDKLIPMVTKMQTNVELIGKDVTKIDKQQEIDYRKFKDDILYNMQRAIDDTYGKASDSKAISKELFDLVEHKTDDIKRNGRDLMENTEDLLDKMSRVQKSVDELHQARGCSERSRSPSTEGDRIKQNPNGGSITATRDDTIVKDKLANIEMALDKVTAEISKTNVIQLIEDRVIPDICSVRKHLETQIEQEEHYKYAANQVPNKQKDRIVYEEGNVGEPRIKRNKNTFKTEENKNLSTNHLGSTEEIGTFLDQFGTVQPFTKWTYPDIPSVNLKQKERKRNSSSTSSSPSSDDDKNRKPARRLSGNKNNLINTPSKINARSRSMSKLNSSVKKRRRESSGSTSSSSDDSTSSLAEHLTNAAMARQVSKISIAVEGIQTKLDQWFKSSKTSIKKSGENTNAMLEKLTSVSKTFDTMNTQDKSCMNKRDDIFKQLDSINEKVEESISVQKEHNVAVDKEMKKLGCINEVVDQVIEKLQEFESLGNEQCKQIASVKEMFRNCNESEASKLDDVLQRMKAIQPNNPLKNESMLGKLDEVLQKIKSTQKSTNQYRETSLSMMAVLMEVKKQVFENVKAKKDENTKCGIDESVDKVLLSLLNDIQPKMDNLYIKVLPVLEDIRKVQRQTTEKQNLEEQETKCHIEKILDLVEDIKEGKCQKNPRLDAPQSSLMDNNTAFLQVFNSFSNELKEQAKGRDQSFGRTLNELKSEIGKLFPKLNEALKTKASEKLAIKLCSTVEEIKTNQLQDMKTFSGMNTMLQGIKASDNKVVAQIKDIRGIFKDFCEGQELTKLTHDFKDMESKHDQSLEEMKSFQTGSFDEMKCLLHLVSKAIEKISQDNGAQKSAKEHKFPQPESNLIQKALSQIQLCNGSLGTDIKKGFSEQAKLIKGLSSRLSEKEKNLAKEKSLSMRGSRGQKVENDQIIQYKEYKDQLDSLENTLAALYIENSSKILEEMDKIKNSSAHSEILNSVEDLKLLTSSTPNAVHDLVPQIEKISADIARIPDDIGSYTAGLEENLCVNLEARVKEIHGLSLESICARLDIIEQRLAVIKKYAKHGPTANSFDRINDNGGTPEQEITAASNRLFIEDSNYGSALLPTTAEEIIGPISRECKFIMEETFNNFKDEWQKSFDIKIGAALGEISTVEQRILQEQAKAVVIEEQFEALANTLLQPILELKPFHAEYSNISGKVSIAQMEERLMAKHNECISALKDIHTITGIATTHGPVIADNQHAIESVARLVGHLKDVQRVQEELLKQGDRSIACQTATNKIYETLVPTLEDVQKVLEKGEEQNFDFGDIPALTKQLLHTINSLNELESTFLASPRLSNCEDLSELIITCLTVLDNLVTSVTEEPSLHSTKQNTVRPLRQNSVSTNSGVGTQKGRKVCSTTVSGRKSKVLPRSVILPTTKSTVPSKTSKRQITPPLKIKAGVPSLSSSAEKVQKCFAVKSKPKRQPRSRKAEQIPHNSQSSAEQVKLQKEVSNNNTFSASRGGINIQTPSPNKKRLRQTSSSADDSGCGDTTPRSTRGSGSLKSPQYQEPDHLPADLGNEENEGASVPTAIDVKEPGYVEQTKAMRPGPKRRRPNYVDLGGLNEKEDSGSSSETILDDVPMRNVETWKNVSEDDAKKPAFQPRVLVSKDLDESKFDKRGFGVVKAGKSPLSAISSPSTFSTSSWSILDDNDPAVKMKN